MSDFKSEAHISVPIKKDSDGGDETHTLVKPNQVVPLETSAAKDKPEVSTKDATKLLTQNVEAEGGKNSADKPSNQFETSLDKRGRAIAIIRDRGNPYCIPIRSKAFEHLLRLEAKKREVKLRKSEIYETIEEIEADAEVEGEIVETFHRVAPIPDGIEIDAGCENQLRYRITPGRFEIVENGSDSIFSRTSISLPLPRPSDQGDLALLDQYLNLDDDERILFKGVASYIIAHPKVPATNFPIVGVISGQGSGKSFLSGLIQSLIDPNTVGVQAMPKTEKDFSIALQNGHLVCIDNATSVGRKADLCCIASSGGTISSRALYTNEDLHLINLHGAILLNGIHDFITQSDMAERSVVLHPLPINPTERKSEAELMADLERDKPAILRGFYDLIGGIFGQWDVKATNPERLIELSDWFARMERIDGVEQNSYQAIYSANLRQVQLNTLLENTLAVAVIQIAEGLRHPWKGTPSDLLDELNQEVSRATQRSPNWPQNSIALSKRLRVLQAGLRSQGIHVEFSRGKERQITLTTDKIQSEY